ncbi:SUKH-4 family immunity protein [Streptomyces sp. NPDC048483]|uniref:SUKH-4 family immunity protein n=1 Tax=Streptomyces sp. NPDC048483 TaxID=3154927 RepID=UPI0034235534
MPFEEATDQVAQWLAAPRRSGLILPVIGAVGAGKSAFLQHLAQRYPHATFIDCRGLDADAVAARLLHAWGHDADFLWRTSDPLSTAVGRISGDGRESLVLLANTQWAGATITSDEPGRIARLVATALERHGRTHVRVLLEGDAERRRVPLTRQPAVVIDGTTPEAPEASHPSPAALLSRFPQLRALACAEQREITFTTWSLLCSALADPVTPTTPITPEQLRDIAEECPGILETPPHAQENSGTERVRFRADGIRQLLGSHRPATAAEQRAITDALLDHTLRRYVRQPWPASSPHVAYAAAALPLHAASAGLLPELLDSAAFLAHVHYPALLQGMSLSYPDGVPQGSRASVVHYLEESGLAPASQAEWVSWLHWAEISRGEREFAAVLAASWAGELPWHTLWSHWRPYAVFGPSPRPDAGVGALILGDLSGTPVVATQQELNQDDLYDYGRDEDEGEEDDGGEELSYDEDADAWAVERLWSLEDGTPLSEPTVVSIYCDDDGNPETVTGRAFRASEAPHDDKENGPAPRTPQAVRRLVAAGDGRWVYGGSGGIFALRVTRPDAVVSAPQWRGEPLLRAHCRSAAWRLPADVRLPADPDRSWLEDIFGEDVCAPLAPAEIPQGITHAGTRDFLTRVGLPALEYELPFAVVEDVQETGLPAYGPRLHRLGSWVHADLLLDGRTGQIFQGAGGEDAPALLSSGVRQFFTLLGLYRRRRQSAFTTRAESVDARLALAAWGSEIDPVTTDHADWRHVFDGDWDHRDAL